MLPIDVSKPVRQRGAGHFFMLNSEMETLYRAAVEGLEADAARLGAVSVGAHLPRANVSGHRDPNNSSRIAPSGVDLQVTFGKHFGNGPSAVIPRIGLNARLKRIRETLMDYNVPSGSPGNLLTLFCCQSSRPLSARSLCRVKESNKSVKHRTAW
jgi:hypothetical protein